jgi:hypothetical protein
METFYLWWSIISTILGVILLVGNVAQFVANKKEKDIHKSQVKIWQHHANGIYHGLFFAAQTNKYSAVSDVQQAIMVIQPSAHSLYTSLNEERLFTEEEIKQKQLEGEKRNQELVELLRKQSASPTSTVQQHPQQELRPRE